ncbi:MAG: gp436 family protein [Caulobacteraceae bacterium]
MSYATLDDLTALCGERELIQLTDRATPPADEVDQALVAEALGRADNLVDSYIGATYQLPLAQASPLLKNLACDIARHWLWKGAASDEVQKRRDEAVKHLQMIATGKAKIPDVQGAQPPAAGGARIISPGGREFTRDSMGGF